MQSPSIPPRRSRKDRLSVDIVPEDSLDTGLHTLQLHQLFGSLSEAGCFSRLVGREGLEDAGDDSTIAKAEDMMLAEIAEFLETSERDEYWSRRSQQPRRILSTPNAVVAELTSPTHRAVATPTADNPIFDKIVQVVAVQLLAACYTVLPATGAYNVSHFHQRKEPRIVTALRLHTYRRFSPAAGHHARETSETSSWPGLFSGPSLEDGLAESTCKRHRLEKFGGERFITRKISAPRSGTIDASRWGDGPTDRRRRRGRHSSGSSSSPSDPGFISRLICQASSSKDSPKSHFLFLHHFLGKGKHNMGKRDKPKPLPSRPHPCPVQKLTSHAVLRIPSSLRLRRTQSFPRTPSHEKPQEPVVLDTRRNSSNPTIGSPISYPFEIPEIRRISASSATGASQASVHSCGRGDFFTAQIHFPGSPTGTFDTGKLSPPVLFDCDPHSLTDGLSPLASSETVVFPGKTRRTDYFDSGHSAILNEQEGNGSSSLDQHMPKPNLGGRPSFSDGSSTSEDSVNNERKRRPMVGRLMDNAEEFSQRLHAREDQPWKGSHTIKHR
ncbi:hypothetical protein K458DRAFT_485205 [Lentithecium fluviatile CBS 122367]|uniref:Uncharacterized protein n=1 Tax=Lentithecium fluviatile CBS 122367 TaxID=1168545 RepID=A0A6G1JBX3_9PLEO|nr:hypothetical protein K458DRAFT_485205 [Lentithecium fluviatile CBS 122367]